MLSRSRSGHPGGSLSCVDILASLFFSGAMVYDHNNPADCSEDFFLLSKGHAAPTLYAVYHQLGWVSDEELLLLRKLSSRLQGHPDAKFLPSVQVCSGSLGQGLAVGVGIAVALLRDAVENNRARQVFVLCGDGELQEGSNWEALALASHLGLSNIVLIVDLNGLQIDGPTEEVCSLGDVHARLASFGWEVREVDGHSLSAVSWELKAAVSYDKGPVALVCQTVKGKGISFMENDVSWHGRAMTNEEVELALSELRQGYELVSEGVMPNAWHKA